MFLRTMCLPGKREETDGMVISSKKNDLFHFVAYSDTKIDSQNIFLSQECHETMMKISFTNK